MLQKIAVLTSLFCVFLCAACREHVTTTSPAALTGSWTMVFGDDCKGYHLKSDNLVLHADGTFDQFVLAQDGRRFDSRGQHWRFLPPNSIELSKRRTSSRPKIIRIWLAYLNSRSL